ncbi:MAG: hypothetical protein JWM28_3278 [Chitinophagaceae bacterium]|nr:hypothetical protein [Chitinophagaceae bacterium]
MRWPRYAIPEGNCKNGCRCHFPDRRKNNHSKDPWKRLLSLVMVEQYTRDKNLHPEINRLVKNLEKDPEYYVKKAVMWIKRNFKKGK